MGREIVFCALSRLWPHNKHGLVGTPNRYAVSRPNRGRYVAAVIALIAQFFSLHTFALSVQCLQSEPPASNVMNVRVHAEMTAEVELPAMLNKEPLRELWLLYEVEQQGVRKTIESQLPTTISDNTARASCSAESTWPNLSLMAFYGAACGSVLTHDFAT